MERFAKNVGRVVSTLLLVAVTACTSIPQTTVGVVEAPKITIDARLLQVCDVKLTPIEDDAEFHAFLISYGEAVTLLHSCACKFIETRNLACTISKFPCTIVHSCKGVSK